MNYSELLKLRRSVRIYEERDVPLEIIREMIKESTYAPTASNTQPWRYVIINDRSVMKRISDECKSNLLKRMQNNPGDYAKRYEQLMLNKEYNVFYNAPCAVYILGDRNYKNLMVDSALAASYFMFAAASRGLGTCWLNFAAVIQTPEMLSELGIPEDCKIVAPIIVGYPKNIPAMPKRKEPEILKIISPEV
ncbi:MAG: nitroreductase family protein [bacterium]|nr:nitroreductase family protein [bacterium]